MEIHLDGPSAAPLVRLGVHVDGPAETAVLARLAAAGDLTVPLGRLVAAIEATGVSQVEAAAIVRAVLVRLDAGGAVERLGGGYRLTDPTLVRTVLQDRAASRAVAGPAPPGGPGTPATVAAPLPSVGSPAPSPSDPDVAAYLQRIVVSRQPGTQADSPRAVAPGPGLPAQVRAALARDGWTPVAEVPAGMIVRRPAAAGEVAVVVPPVPASRPAVAALGRLGPGTQFVFDLRSLAPQPAEMAAPRSGDPSPAATSAADPAAAAVAGAAGVVSQDRTRRTRRRGRVRDLSAVFEALFGLRLTDLLADGDAPDAAAARPSGEADRPAALLLVAQSFDADAVFAPDGDHGLLVEVLVMATDEPALAEVLAFLDDSEGTRLLAPRT